MSGGPQPELVGNKEPISRRPAGSSGPASFYRRRGKRALDLVLAAGAVTVTLPIQVAVALAVRLRLGSPILFRQARPGMGEHLFTMWKFRTMSDAFGADGRPLPDADRLTTLGRFLRSTSMDELPELYNVLRGDMSLVGPRPLIADYLPRYNADQHRRHEVRPGITGWAQVHGRNNKTWESKFADDVWYVDHCSLRLDAMILMATIVQVLSRSDISAQGHATAPEFGIPQP